MFYEGTNNEILLVLIRAFFMIFSVFLFDQITCDYVKNEQTSRNPIQPWNVGFVCDPCRNTGNADCNQAPTQKRRDYFWRIIIVSGQLLGKFIVLCEQKITTEQ